MCLACHFVCCALDTFGQCGCEHCSEPDCWLDNAYDGEDPPDDEVASAPFRAAARFRCQEIACQEVA